MIHIEAHHRLVLRKSLPLPEAAADGIERRDPKLDPGDPPAGKPLPDSPDHCRTDAAPAMLLGHDQLGNKTVIVGTKNEG